MKLLVTKGSPYCCSQLLAVASLLISQYQVPYKLNNAFHNLTSFLCNT